MRIAPSHSGLKIAIVEDHDDLRELFVDFLTEQGHEVYGFASADDLDQRLVGETVDLLILDLNLPGEDGYSIAKRQRAVHDEMHILILTARTAVADRIKGYVSGADNYLTKPVSPAELAVVVESIMRRVVSYRLNNAEISVNNASLQLSGPAGTLTLTPPEMLILKNLAYAPGCKLTYWRLLELLQIDMDEKGKAALEVRISRLKKKMHEIGAPEPAIKSVWKEGYQLCMPVQILN
jgi:DNA-binding response OmpR family regulator